MKEEQLSKGVKLLEKIKEKRKIIDIMNNGYVKCIQGFDYSHGKNGEKVVYNMDDDLKLLVLSYLNEELRILEEEFSKL